MVKNDAKIITLERYEGQTSNLRGKKKVLVGGCFDLLHYGHYSFLSKAKDEGDYLIVALESDEFIHRFKKRNPIHNQRQRAEILAALDIVDLVVMLPFFESDQDYVSFVKKIKPDIIAVTRGDSQESNKRKQAHSVGGSVRIVTPLLTAYSTQKIINSLA